MEDKSIVTGSVQTITCDISGLSAAADVTWIDPSGNAISESDTSNYVVDQGNLISEAQTATLTIKLPVLASITAPTTFTCKVKSGHFPDYSPEVVKTMLLTPLTLGKSFHANI